MLQDKTSTQNRIHKMYREIINNIDNNKYEELIQNLTELDDTIVIIQKFSTLTQKELLNLNILFRVIYNTLQEKSIQNGTVHNDVLQISLNITKNLENVQNQIFPDEIKHFFMRDFNQCQSVIVFNNTSNINQSQFSQDFIQNQNTQQLQLQSYIAENQKQQQYNQDKSLQFDKSK